MGLFSGITNILGKVANSPLLSAAGTLFGNPAIGFATSALGSLYKNKQAKDAASAQMAFQSSMSNTSYQRAMADMKAAGLNPILAYQQGGASTPGGSSYSPENVGSSALSGGTKSASLRNLVEQTNNLQANSGLARAQTRKTEAETRIALANAGKAEVTKLPYDLLNQLIEGMKQSSPPFKPPPVGSRSQPFGYQK